MIVSGTSGDRTLQVLNSLSSRKEDYLVDWWDHQEGGDSVVEHIAKSNALLAERLRAPFPGHLPSVVANGAKDDCRKNWVLFARHESLPHTYEEAVTVYI